MGEICNKCECDIRDYGKKISKMECSFEETMEALQKANTSLEEANVQYKDKEDELSALSRRIMLLETESNGADVKLAKTTMELALDSKRLGVVQEELKKAEERADSNQKKVDTIDEELKVVGENMKALEVAEGKALEREEKFKEQILILLNRLKIADARAEYGEMNITKLNQRIDNIEDDIIRAKVKSSHVGGEVNDTFKDIMHKY